MTSSTRFTTASSKARLEILCDTQVILWLMLNDARLRPATEAILADRDNEVLFSSASLFEIAVKIRVGKFETSVEAVDANCRRAGMTHLPITCRMLLRYPG